MQLYLIFGKAPPDETCGVAPDNRVGRYIAGNNGSGGDHRTSPYRRAGKDDRVVSDPDIVLYDHLEPIAAARIPYALANLVDTVVIPAYERNVFGNEYVVAHHEVALNAAVFSELNPVPKDNPPMRRKNRR